MKKIFIIILNLLVFQSFSQVLNVCSQAKIKNYSQALKKNNASNFQMEQMEKYDVFFHHLDLKVERTSTYISGSVRTMAISRALLLDTFVFQLYRSLNIDSILGSGQQNLTFYRIDDVAYVILNQPITKGNLIDVKIYYHGTPPDGGSAAIGSGFSNKSSPKYGNQITWSLSQPYSAYEWWPCKQSLQDKIDSAYIYITTDTSNKAASNGLLKAIIPAGNGKHRYEWKTNYLIDYYLIAATVGQYNEYINYAKPKQISDSILIQHYYYNKTQAYTDGIKDMKVTATQIELFSDLFGLYPFYKEKYGHVMAPFSGGMEHQTMTSLGYFNFELVGHELAHQWFGDHVTCATWKDIWLNEGFATYLEYLAEYYLFPASAAATIANIQTSAKGGIGSVYVYDTTDVGRIFSSRLTYNKGASVIHVLHYLLGDSMFYNVCKTYQARFAKSTATTEDFIKVVNDITVKDYRFFFNQWIYNRGFPFYNVRWNYANGKLYIKTTQTNAQDTGNLFSIPVPYEFTLSGKDTIIYLQQNKATEYYEIALNQTVTGLKSIDPDNWILCEKYMSKDPLLVGLKEDTEHLSIKMFPNPAHHILKFFNPNQIKFKLVIFNLQGELCLSRDMNIATTEFDISLLKTGIYFVELTDESGNRKIEKLVID
ncbi:MAG: M1 family aminopeptidase [Bacteroidota bacterium]|nr:M1 family aminopeptidase [Bacteroidota bacterium]